MGFLRFCGSQKTKGRRKSPLRVSDAENHLKNEPMRVPNDAARFDRMSVVRCDGQKPRYKNVRRGLGRAVVNVSVFNNRREDEVVCETAG